MDGQLPLVLAQQPNAWPSLVLPLVGTALGGVLAIVGGWIAERLRFKTEMRVRREQAEWELDQRRRERREATYIEIASIAHEVFRVCGGAPAYLEDGMRAKTVIDLTDAMDRYRGLFGQTYLFADDEVRDGFHKLHVALTAFYNRLVDDQLSGKGHDADVASACITDITEALGSLTLSMRRDLGY